MVESCVEWRGRAGSQQPLVSDRYTDRPAIDENMVGRGAKTGMKTFRLQGCEKQYENLSGTKVRETCMKK